MKERSFDAILVVAGDDYKNINVVIESVKKFIEPDIVYIISPYKDLQKNKKNIEVYDFVKLVDENDVLNIQDVNFDDCHIPGMPERRFWYYQQFLKLGFGLTNISTKEHYLIWDADTVPIKEIEFFSNDGRIFLTESDYEYHFDYFKNIKYLLGDIKLHNKSFISQHLMVNKVHLKSFMRELKKSSDLSWYNFIVSSLRGSSQSLFSEYETFSNYVINRFIENYEVREVSWFRHANCLNVNVQNLELLASYYSYVSLEKFDVGLFRCVYFKFRHFINIFRSGHSSRLTRR
ncbi:MAG: hypothetical protein IE909_18150 [Campylobacterales bacterium]|nr:hypothetical protein [Campylobacterales bacterium]